MLGRKFSFEVFGSKGPWMFFKFYEKLMHGTFVIVLLKVSAAWRLKIDLDDFFWELVIFVVKDFIFVVMRAKKSLKGSKMTFFKIYGKWVHGIFLFFCTKLLHHKDLQLTQIIFWNNLAFWFFRSKSFWENWVLYLRSHSNYKNWLWNKNFWKLNFRN